MTNRAWTETEIKAAFWAMFYESGEHWFSYFGSKEERDNSMWYPWNEFRVKLGIDVDAAGWDEVDP